jgi:hypothetical protein
LEWDLYGKAENEKQSAQDKGAKDMEMEIGSFSTGQMNHCSRRR